MRSTLMAFLYLTSLAIADEPKSIWGRRIMPQPFEAAPFHEIRIPAWLQETSAVGYTLSGQTTERREQAVRLGVTISEMNFVDPFYPYYDSRLLKKRSPHVPLDRIDKEVAEYRRLGLRILAVYPPCLQGEVYETHPDWRRIATNTREFPQVDMQAYPYGGMLCLLGPYGDFFVDVLAEVTEKYKVDAWSFDGLHYGGVCYCEHCRTAYQRDQRAEIPNVDLHDPAFRRYQHWADRRMEALIQRLQTRLKGINPDTALVTWTTNAGRFGHFRDVPRNMPARMNLLLDAPDQEFWLDETNRGATIVPALANAYIWACTNHRVAFSEPYLMSHGNPYGKDSFPGHEIERRVLLALTHGAGPSLAVVQPKHMQAATDHALAEVQRRREWLTHKTPEPWAALLLSDNTRVFYGREAGQVEERYLAPVFGAFRATLEEHLPTAVICDWNLTPEDLSKYAVLILPNAACLSDEQCAAVREYVAQGGGLVASLDASLCNEFGDPRNDFGLADVFGAHHRGPVTAPEPNPREPLDVNFARGLGPDYWRKRQNTFDLRLALTGCFDDEKLNGLLGAEPVTFKGPAVRVALDDPGSAGGTFWPKGGDEKTASAAPVVRRTFGRGRVAYLAAGLDAAYYTYAYPYQRRVLTQAIRWAAAQPPGVDVAAPMCVHSTVFRQRKDGRERLLIHLYNDVNTTAFHGLPDDEAPLREETIPIHDIVVRLRGHQPQAVRQQPENLAIAPAAVGDEIVLRVPRLDVHSVVVVELSEAGK